MHRNLSDLMKDIADEARLSPKEIERGMGKPYSSFRDGLNPNRPAKTYVDDIVPFCETFDTLEPLRWIAAHLGQTIAPMHQRQPDGRSMDHECRQVFDAAGELSRLVESGAPYTEVVAAVERLSLEAQDVAKRVRSEQATAKMRAVK